MIENSIKMNENILKKLSEKENIEFLESLNSKIKNTEKELKILENKEEKVLKKIAENKKYIENNPRKSREYINNSESILKCIEVSCEHLTNLIKCYTSIQNSLIIVTEKTELGVFNKNLENDVNELLNKIEETKKYEKNVKIDNEKNYIIIDSFLNKSFKGSIINEEKIAFSDLTLDNLKDNTTLKICEKRVELPYTKEEIEEYIKIYPNNYKRVQDVISKEFMIHISVFKKHPVLSRFRETYYLCRTKEMMSVIDSFMYAKNIMFRSDINSYIIAAMKSVRQLEDYIECLEQDKMDEFKHFKIVFEVNPLSI